MTINLIVNALTPVEAMLHILQQRPNEGTPIFLTHDQAIMNFSKDINVVVNKS
jgi:hypothetical protein